MELEKLLKQREAYTGQIIKLGIQIAVIFLLPAVLAVFLSKYFEISFLYFFPGAFIISWTGVVILYRKISKKMKDLDKRINELRKEQGQTHTNT